MTSHSYSNFLTSCLKVPIDPCNRCPAPEYNRPFVFLGNSGKTVNKKKQNTGGRCSTRQKTETLSTSRKLNEFDTNSQVTSDAIRSLAKLYDSIPDYCEINHLPEEEFYSTLESLKDSCYQLKNRAYSICTPNRTSSNNSTYTVESESECKQIKNKQSGQKNGKNYGRLRSSSSKKFHRCKSTAHSTQTSNTFRAFYDRMQSASVQPTLDTTYLSLSMKDERSTADPISKAISLSRLSKSPSQSPSPKEGSLSPAINGRLPLKKSYSFNDVRPNPFSTKQTVVNDAKSKDGQPDSPIKYNALRIEKPFSSYFPRKFVNGHNDENGIAEKLEQMTISVPTECHSIKNKCDSPRSFSKKKTETRQNEKLLFSFFGVGDNHTKKKKTPMCSPSPVHPVARPNLAATLRAEVAKKRVKELQSNCTFRDNATPQVDWEVRKTPAWKSLNYNATHQQILSMRLATRKAEQRLQERQNELNMELMRQRVKSAPLLLEGTTFWGPNVGKLTHTCYKDNIKPNCINSKRKYKKSKKESHSKNSSSRKSFSRNSNFSTNIQNICNNDSDDLSSVDRAYL